MKMFLTRMGFGSKAVVTGDVTQIDLPKGHKSGLIEAQLILGEVRGITFTQFLSEDVVRHPLVQRIVHAYEQHGSRRKADRLWSRRRPVCAFKPRSGLALTVQYATANDRLPTRSQLRAWVKAALQHDASITVRLVAAEEGRTLNRQYRGRDHATNVLTFVYSDTDPLAGDIVLCVPVIEREAREQHKNPQAHYAHLVVHGMLHLQGYHHEGCTHAMKRSKRKLSPLKYATL
jgi:probable rRNA maturation factor